MEGDFRRYFDTDPLEAFPDWGAKYFQLSAELATAEGRKLDALAFFHGFLTNPYFRREYTGPASLQSAQGLWKELGGSDAGWAAYSTVPTLPPGVPTGRPGVSYLPWVKVDYKLPPIQLADLDGRVWTNQDFAAKATIVYLWASWCAPCWPSLGAIQTLSERVKGRGDAQVVTLSVDEDRDKLLEFMKQKGYTYPVLVSKAYVESILPKFQLGQFWIVDENGSVRRQRTSNPNVGGPDIEELLYKAGQLGK